MVYINPRPEILDILIAYSDRLANKTGTCAVRSELNEMHQVGMNQNLIPLCECG